MELDVSLTIHSFIFFTICVVTYIASVLNSFLYFFITVQIKKYNILDLLDTYWSVRINIIEKNLVIT